MSRRSSQLLVNLLGSKTVVALKDMQKALKGASRATVFRYLKQVPYRRSYNRNGCYYTLNDPARYDRFGLFSHEGIHFSRDGGLGATVLILVREAVAGYTQRELKELLRVRVQVILLKAVRDGEIDREKVDAFYVYFHTEPEVRKVQLERRREQIESQKAAEEATDHIVIQVLLALIRHPGSKVADVVRYLHGHSPPISRQHVVAVFDRYALEGIGEKGGPSSC